MLYIDFKGYKGDFTNKKRNEQIKDVYKRQDIRRSRRYIRQKRWLHFLSVIFFMAVVITAASFVVFLVMEVTHFL